MQIEIDQIPLPTVVYESEPEVAFLNAAYEERFGPQLCPDHLRLLQSFTGGAHESITVLNDGRLLAIFHPDVERLRQRDRLVRRATRIARVGGWEYQPDVDDLHWSEELYLIHQLDFRQTPTLESSLEFYPGSSRELLKNLLDRALETGKTFDVELPFISAQGNKMWVRSRGHAEWQDGRCVRLYGTLQDITEQRQVRERLAELLERFAFAQSSASFGVWDFDPTRGTLHWDQAMFTLYDVDPESFRGRFEDWSDCVVEEDVDGTVELLEQAINENKSFDTEFRIRLSDGQVRWIKATAHITRTEDGRASRLVGFNYDITAIKAVEEELRASNVQLEQSNERLEELAASSLAASVAKSEFLANMSHEIRTPMNGVLGLATLLLETELTPQQRDSVEIMCKSAEALLLLINDLLDFSKVESGAVQLEERTTDLREVVDDLVEFLAVQAQQKEISFRYCIDHRVPLLVGIDAGRLRQILINLLGNAIKFTDIGTVEMMVEVEAGHLRFTVSDTGIGMSAEELARVFEPFAQADTSSAKGGTGLGLAICERLVELMGGTIRVKSAEDQGTEFTVRLPFTPVAQPDAERDLVGRGVMITGGRAEERRPLQEILQFLGIGEPETEVEVELVFPGARPRYPDAGHILMLPVTQASHIDRAEMKDFSDVLTLPLRHRRVQQVLRKTLGLEKQPPAEVESTQLVVSVLVAEDNAVNQKVISKLLKKVGCEFEIASNGVEACRLAETELFDLILMDLQMPLMDGFEAARQIRAEGLNRETPIIALTAHATAEHKERCFDCGMNDYVTKPIRLAKLREVVKNWAL